MEVIQCAICGLPSGYITMKARREKTKAEVRSFRPTTKQRVNKHQKKGKLKDYVCAACGAVSRA